MGCTNQSGMFRPCGIYDDVSNSRFIGELELKDGKGWNDNNRSVSRVAAYLCLYVPIHVEACQLVKRTSPIVHYLTLCLLFFFFLRGSSC